MVRSAASARLKHRSASPIATGLKPPLLVPFKAFPSEQSEPILDMRLAVVAASSPALQLQCQPFIFCLDVKDFISMCAQDNTYASPSSLVAILITLWDCPFRQTKFGDYICPVSGSVPLISKLSTDNSQCFTKGIICSPSTTVVRKEVSKAVDFQDAANHLGPRRERVPDIMIQRFTSRLPSFDHSPSFSGDLLPISWASICAWGFQSESVDQRHYPQDSR